MNTPLFRTEVLQKQQNLFGQINLIQPTPVRWLAFLLVLIVVVGICFLASGQYSRKQRVAGVLQPMGGVLRLHVENGGIVSNVFVQNGQSVIDGEPLAEISNQQFDERQNELSDTLLNQARKVLEQFHNERQQLSVQQQLSLEKVSIEITNLIQQLVELNSQHKTMLARLALNDQQLQRLLSLSVSGYISEIEINRQRDQLLFLQQQEKEMRALILQSEQQLFNKRNSFASLPAEHAQILINLEQQVLQQQSRLAELSYRQKNVLKAPKTGVVSTLQLKVGHQVKSNQLALSLLPERQILEAFLYIPTSAIGFVEVGQEARLRYHAYPYQRFGIFSGIVLEISETVLLPSDLADFVIAEPSFRVRVELPSQTIKAYQKELPLKAGMILDADLVTEKRSLFEWVFEPIYSLKEQI